MVHYIESLNYGDNIICEEHGKHQDMLMDIIIEKLEKGNKRTFINNEKETAILLLGGKATIKWLSECEIMERYSVFDENPCCLHIPHSIEVTLIAEENTELLIQRTTNKEMFDAKYYTKEECKNVIAGEGTWNSTARRIIRTIFDYNNAPYSNMVMGEVITYPGKWSSYPPHYHPQPEVYYYKFDKSQGFGFSLIGDKAYKIKDNSFATIPGGLVHPQTSAPGYAMYYCWMIRHFENNPWTDRIDAKEHKWLWEDDVENKIWQGK